MKKLICLILALALCLGLAACGSSGSNSASSDQYPELAGKKIVQAAEYHYTLDFGCQETFNLIFLVTDAYNPNMGSAGIYMLDTDSGTLYDDSFLDWDIMIQGDSWNMDTRDTALMVLFNSYDCNKDGDILWSDAETFTHYSSSQIAKLSSQLSGGSAASSGNEPQATEQVYTEVNESATQPAIDPEFVYEQAKLLNIELNAVTKWTYELDTGCRETLNMLFFESTEFDGYQETSFAAPGLYMLDLDTGIWYDSSFMDWDLMVKGDRWNYGTRESGLMCMFTFFDQCRNEGSSVGDNAVSMDAATLEEINQKLLFDRFTHKTAPYPYASIDDEPRKLSDEDLANLMHRPAGYVKSAISTVPDAIAYLDMRFPSLWMGMTLHNGIDQSSRWLRSAITVLSDYANPASRSCMVNSITYLLSDDYQIESLIAFWVDPNTSGQDGPQKVINCIKTDTGYLFFDPVVRMQGDAESRKGALLPEMSCSSVAEYIQNIRTNPALSADVRYIFKNTNGVRMNYTVSFAGGYSVTTKSEGLEMVYYSTGEESAVPEEAVNLITPENIGKYKLSSMLGGVTLTAEEAKTLVGAAPEVVQEKVKTAADVLMYMLAAQTGDTHGCLCTDVGEYTWHWNISAKEVMSMGLGNCGSCANLANYLLDGDYEEVGYMDQAYYPGNGGSHVYTYILHEGKYYIIDYSWFIFNNYDPALDYAPFVLNSLTEWPEKIPYVYGPVCLVMTYDTPGMQYPVIFGDAYQQELGGMYYVLPEGAEYTVLYEAPDGYRYHHIPFDTSAYNWNVFW